MRTNEAGLAIIKDFEGFLPAPYLDPIGIPTIGYGSIWGLDRARVTMAHPDISEGDGEILLDWMLQHTERAVRRLIHVPLTESKFSALVSFTYNLGSGNLQASTLRMKANRGDIIGAADEFPKWRRAGGRILRGLVRRRAEERALWLAQLPPNRC
jgi:lysozyme